MTVSIAVKCPHCQLTVVKNGKSKQGLPSLSLSK